MRHIVSAACGLWLCLSGAALAQAQSGVVVELYTSQGCSSCPPADEFLSALVSNPGVIALALHVDYWDYIGWKDVFGQPQFTDRQKSYARAIGGRTIYTPQVIVGGLDRVEGSQPEEVARLIAKHMDLSSPVTLQLERAGNRVTIRATAEPPLTSAARVQLVRYRPKQTVTIERGENAGRTVTYHNIVTDWQVLETWPGRAPFEIVADVSGSDRVVVIIQRDGPAEVLAAARLD
jgi:hypothetical protein